MKQPAAFILLFLSLSLAPPALASDLPAFCKALVKHVPDADVTYQPGIDVHGKPVVPADLDSATLALPDKIEIPLTVDLMKATGLNATDYPFSLMNRNDIKLGTLVLEDNHVTFNGKPLSDDQQEKLGVLCLTAR